MTGLNFLNIVHISYISKVDQELYNAVSWFIFVLVGTDQILKFQKKGKGWITTNFQG